MKRSSKEREENKMALVRNYDGEYDANVNSHRLAFCRKQRIQPVGGIIKKSQVHEQNLVRN